MRGIILKFFLFGIFTCFGFVSIHQSYAKECALYLELSLPPAQVSPQRYRIAAYNVFNLFLRTGKYVWTDEGLVKFETDNLKPNKPHHQVEKLATTINEINADIMLMTEVEGEHSLDVFIKEYLNDAYQGYTTPSNDGRDLRISLIVKKDRDLDVEVISFEGLKFQNPLTGLEEPWFVRNLPIYLIKRKSTGEYLFAVVGVHFKSQRNRSKDENSVLKRTAEAVKAAEIIKDFKSEVFDIPIMLMGDFNADIYAPEFETIRDLNLHNPYETHFEDPHGLGLITHSHHGTAETPDYKAFDHILVDPVISKGLIRAFIYRYFDDEGKVKDLPRTQSERDQNPSDHFPKVIDIDL